MSSLHSSQLQYLVDVLGIKGFIIPERIGPDTDAGRASRFSTNESAVTENAVSDTSNDLRVWQAQGPTTSRLVFLSAASGYLPFSGELGEMLEKMAQAMKIRLEDCLQLQTDRDPLQSAAGLQPELRSDQSAADFERIVVCFGETAVRWLVAVTGSGGEAGTPGRWWNTRDSDLPASQSSVAPLKIMPTFALEQLQEKPGAKKEAWKHLQLVMKEL